MQEFLSIELNCSNESSKNSANIVSPKLANEKLFMQIMLDAVPSPFCLTIPKKNM